MTLLAELLSFGACVALFSVGVMNGVCGICRQPLKKGTMKSKMLGHPVV